MATTKTWFAKYVKLPTTPGLPRVKVIPGITTGAGVGLAIFVVDEDVPGKNGTRETAAQFVGRRPEKTLSTWPEGSRQKRAGLFVKELELQLKAGKGVKVVLMLPRAAVLSKAAKATPGDVVIWPPPGKVNSCPLSM